MSDKTFENYSLKNIADKVSSIDIDRNAYIFISKNYTPITSGAWNKIMKKFFKKLELKLTQERKLTT